MVGRVPREALEVVVAERPSPAPNPRAAPGHPGLWREMAETGWAVKEKSGENCRVRQRGHGDEQSQGCHPRA